jgi:PAS domain-containing protein
MRQNTRLEEDAASDVLNELLSINHGWWCDYIEEYTDKTGNRRQKLANRPYFSPAFLEMYGFSKEEMCPQAIFRDNETLRNVLRDIREVIRPGSKARSGRVVAYTKSGEKKLVEAYIRRIERPDGSAMLASLHSDLTISSDVQWIERNVLDKLQAFVFVKRWNPISRKFVFTYMNEKLREVLNPDPVKFAKGLLSDDDFFDDWAQKRAFREVDEAIKDTNTPDLVVMREETFDPKQQDEGVSRHEADIPKRLLTFKTPLSIPSRISPEIGWEILGIAIDVTNVTDVLRSIAEKSESGLYIKDNKHRYLYVNKKYMELLNASDERQILDRTFDEALRELKERNASSVIGQIPYLPQQIEAEDKAIFAGLRRSEHVRPLNLPVATHWLTIKQPIESQDRGITHILGMTAPVFPGRLADILDKVPQCISVKKYYPEERDQSGEFKIVWANRSFLGIHQMNSLTEVIGKNDFELWSGDREQVEQFRRRDRMAVESYTRLRDSAGWNSVSPDERWRQQVKDLVDECGCWEFRETTRSKTDTRVLQTTKWAVEICDNIFVVVVYSDVTIGDVEQRRYHEHTVHNLRGAIYPIATAREHLERILECSENRIEDRIRYVLACLDDTSHAVELFVKHHLDLLKMQVVARPTELKEVIASLELEKDKLERNWDVHVRIKDCSQQSLVLCDLNIMRFVMSELLLNAVKAVRRRKDEWERESSEYVPEVVVQFSQSGREVQCAITDNGAACIDEDERKKLSESFQRARFNPFDKDIKSFGLAFCFTALAAQSCRMELETPGLTGTTFKLYLPLPCPGVA